MHGNLEIKDFHMRQFAVTSINLAKQMNVHYSDKSF